MRGLVLALLASPVLADATPVTALERATGALLALNSSPSEIVEGFGGGLQYQPLDLTPPGDPHAMLLEHARPWDLSADLSCERLGPMTLARMASGQMPGVDSLARRPEDPQVHEDQILRKVKLLAHKAGFMPEAKASVMHCFLVFDLTQGASEVEAALLAELRPQFEEEASKGKAGAKDQPYFHLFFKGPRGPEGRVELLGFDILPGTQGGSMLSINGYSYEIDPGT